MLSGKQVKCNTQAWEEGELGLAAEHCSQTPASVEKAVDEALGLQTISIRLHKSTVDEYKSLAEAQGLSCLALMRQVLEFEWVNAR